MTARNRPLESRVTKKILEYLRLRGVYAQKTHGNPMTTRGQLDVISCFHGRYIGLEIKRDQAGKPTALQRYHIQQIRKAGGVAEVVWSVDQVRKILDDIENLPTLRDRKTPR